MELSGSLLPQFKAGETQLTFTPSPKCVSRRVVGMFTGETFPVQSDRWKNLEVHCDNDEKKSYVNRRNESSKHSGFSLIKLQVTEEEYTGTHLRDFGRFVAREAVLDEELWSAAWLRAEANAESSPNKKYIQTLNFKMAFAEKEFCALKLRCSQPVEKILECTCLVAVRKQEKARMTILKSIVGTLDLSIRKLGQGETYPGEIRRVFDVSPKIERHNFAYIANVVVAKWARRRGIALNMLYLAIDAAKTKGMKKLYVHAYADNKPALDLYKKIGFQIVEATIPSTLQEYRLLLSMDL